MWMCIISRDLCLFQNFFPWFYFILFYHLFYFLGKSSFLPILALCVCVRVCVFQFLISHQKQKKNCNRIHRIVFFSSLFPIKTSKWIIIIINIIIILKETKKNTPKNYYLKKNKDKNKRKDTKRAWNFNPHLFSFSVAFFFVAYSLRLISPLYTSNRANTRSINPFLSVKVASIHDRFVVR